MPGARPRRGSTGRGVALCAAVLSLWCAVLPGASRAAAPPLYQPPAFYQEGVAFIQAHNPSGDCAPQPDADAWTGACSSRAPSFQAWKVQLNECRASSYGHTAASGPQYTCEFTMGSPVGGDDHSCKGDSAWTTNVAWQWTAAPNPLSAGLPAPVHIDKLEECLARGQNVIPECADAVDNDGDGAVDFPADTGCTALQDTSEVNPKCSDGKDNDGDGKTDHPADPGCSTRSDDSEQDANRPPVARRDAWVVKPGFAADETVLANDYDPDGDAITARVLKISFASKEWSGLDTDGGFLYVAGPGTKGTLNKTITYVAVDSHGAPSPPARAVVTVTRPAAGTKPFKKAKIAAGNIPTWLGPFGGWGQVCMGSGLGAYCYTMLSVSRTAALNASTGWTSDLSGAAQACLAYGFIPMKNADCAKELLKRSAAQVWDKSVVDFAAKDGSCLMFRVDRVFSIRHPRAGKWGKPEYSTLRSGVRPYNGSSTNESGYGYWSRGAIHRWRVPLFCDENGRVYRQVYQPLVAVD